MDAGSSPSSSPLHVVIVPFLAFGHLIPALGLAERLASRGHRVSLVSTPRNIARLQPVAAPLVDLVALPLPRVDGLPDGAESTHDIPSDEFNDKFELLQKASNGLAAPFSEFLDAACTDGCKKPDCVIVDSLPWAASSAVKHKVPCVKFSTCPASFVADWWGAGSGQGQSATLPRFEMERRKSFVATAELVAATIETSDLVVIRTCLELEPATPITLLGKPVVPLGLLPPPPNGGRRKADGDTSTLRWLDAQPAKSVVYVAMGSEAPVRVEQVRELALGLELAGTGFLWALRRPSGAGDLDDADILPPGFEQRTSGRGLVATGWVPQVSVLAHAAVGAFLTHCGWGSVIEGLLFGHPLVMLPMYVDQGHSARFVEGRGAGVQVPRDEGDGSFDREGVAAAVRAVAVEEESRGRFAASAKKLQETVADRERHERYIDGVVQRLRDLAAKG